MIKLIKIELKKILHKKSLTIILGIMVIFCLLNNILYWLDYDEEGIYQGMKAFDRGEVKAMNVDFEKYNQHAVQQFEKLFEGEA